MRQTESGERGNVRSGKMWCKNIQRFKDFQTGVQQPGNESAVLTIPSLKGQCVFWNGCLNTCLKQGVCG